MTVLINVNVCMYKYRAASVLKIHVNEQYNAIIMAISYYRSVPGKHPWALKLIDRDFGPHI